MLGDLICTCSLLGRDCAWLWITARIFLHEHWWQSAFDVGGGDFAPAPASILLWGFWGKFGTWFGSYMRMKVSPYGSAYGCIARALASTQH